MEKKHKTWIISLLIISSVGIALFFYYDYRITHYDIPEDYPAIIGTGETYHIDSTGGSDQNSGLSVEEAWKTVEKVNSYSFSEGDRILFKRNCSWRERIMPQSGSKEGWLYYGDYGQGQKPLFLGSITLEHSQNWIDENDKIWSWSQKLTKDVGNVIFNNESSVGTKKWTRSSLKNQGDFYYDKNTQMLSMYSPQNPAEYYQTIECALGQHMLYLPHDEHPHIGVHGVSNIIFANLSFRYGGAYAFKFQSVHHIQIINCDIAWMGGAEVDGQPLTRYGNGIEFFGLAFHCKVQGNIMEQIYDSGVSFQAINSPASAFNIVFTNNTIKACGYAGYELWLHSPKGEITNVSFTNNILKDIGYGWGGQENQRKQGAEWGFAYLLDVTPSPTKNLMIKKNIVSNTYRVVFARANIFNGFKNLDIDENFYYGDSDDLLYVEFEVGTNGAEILNQFTFEEFKEYQSSTQMDINSSCISSSVFIHM